MESKGNKSHEVLLGKYELGRLLGRGTFAKVYHARSLADGSPVAVKVLDKPSPDAAPRILREISSMRRLSHPNIIRLHEVMATRSKIYLVMDFAAGGELLNRLRRRGHLPETAARRYFHQLLSALRFSHARGVAHRDLKPQNLLLDVSGDLKLSDFGLSADLRLPLATSCGTPAYTAPEVLRGKPYDGAKADAWSCGVILFVLLSGCIPFDDANLALMYRKTQKKEYKFPPWITPPARKVIAKLLDPNPESRITLDAVADLAWYKRSFSLDQQLSLMNLPPLPRDHLLVQQSLNAFDIISMSSGLDLSGLFDGVDGARRFISTAGMEKIVERIEDAGAKLGYVMEKRKGVRLGSPVVLTVEVSEVASPMLLVEMRVESGGDGERFCWGDLRAQLGEIVLSWHKDGDV